MKDINTFVVLVLENPSFDHMLGFLKNPTYSIDGLNGTESNPVDPNVVSPQLVYVSPDAQYYGDLDDPSALRHSSSVASADIGPLPHTTDLAGPARRVRLEPA